MFSFQEYLIGWSIYLFSVVILLVVFWRMTRFIPWRYLRDCVRLLGAVFLLLPVPIEVSSSYWAPAWIKALLNIIFDNIEAFWPLSRLFLLVLCITYLVYFLSRFYLLMFGKISGSVTSEAPHKKTSNKKVAESEKKEPHLSSH